MLDRSPWTWPFSRPHLRLTLISLIVPRRSRADWRARSGRPSFGTGSFCSLKLVIGKGMLLAAVAFASCWIPARRVTGLSPMTAIRHD